MNKLIHLFLYMACSLVAGAQLVFKTDVKQGPVVVGEAFRVQYVLEDMTGTRDFTPPEFRGFRFVSGPSVYEGQAYGTDGIKKLRNIVYTLEAVKPGRFLIGGASVYADDRYIKSDDVRIEVITAVEAIRRGLNSAPRSDEAATVLYPGEDAERKIRDNLFVKVTVDKTSCFTGEAVTATFKLYSRLTSRSDIVKNPGFYGFTVQDMIGLTDKQSTSEMINGKRFEVHTIRKVQLYPLRAGSFVIDAMEIVNKVAFSRKGTNRQPEQEIVEGIVPDRTGSPGSDEYKSTMYTPRLTITVKEPPLKNRPENFAGATGRFRITAAVNKSRLANNEEGYLVVAISGAGNFVQLGQPVIQWPAGIEGFDPKISDSLDHTVSPLTGTRLFRFAFAAARPGQYIIPAIPFTFFDPAANSYMTVSSSPLSVTISDREKPAVAMPAAGRRHSPISGWLIGVGVMAVVAGVGLIGFRRKRRIAQPSRGGQKQGRPTVSEILKQAFEIQQSDTKRFYIILRQCIWQFFSLYAGLAGSAMNTRNLDYILREKQADEECRAAIAKILQQCDTNIFTGAGMETDHAALLQQTSQALEKIARCFASG